MKNIVILGSTGSIGRQTLEVVRHLGFRIFALSAHQNFKLLKKQILEFKPRYALLSNHFGERKVVKKIGKTEILYGQKNFKKIVSDKKIDLVVNALVGAAGILPSFWTLQAKKDLALANKESLVCAGSILMEKAKKNRVKILPMDSEHSAIWQLIQDERHKNIKRIILTCSGGPFFGKSQAQLGKSRKFFKKVTPKMALRHPKWKMGPKISIDCATLANKGFEVIEASHLFNLKPEQIDVVIHPESIIHSFVEYFDGSVEAEMAMPDMRLPIQYALTYPLRKESLVKKLDLVDIKKFTFYKPDLKTFGCLLQALKALKIGGTMPAVLNAANEEAVNLFLAGKIKFLDIERINKRVMQGHKVVKKPKLEDILEVDRWAREKISNL